MATLNPTLLGFFGLTPNHIYTEEGSKGLRYPTEPSVDTLNLSQGYGGSNSDRAIGCRDKLSNLVAWMHRHQEQVMEEDGRFNIDIVCEAGLLESFLNHPYETQEGMNDRKQFEDEFVKKSQKMAGVSG